MGGSIFLDSSVLAEQKKDEQITFDIQQNRIKFDLPHGF